MSRRIDIELTSALGDGTWTWRAAGARQPKGVLDASILPADARVGDVHKVEVEQEIDGITVLSIVPGREKPAPAVVQLLPIERDFQPVVETRAPRDRSEGRGRDGDRRPRRDRSDRDRGDRGPRREGGRGRPDDRRGEGRGEGERTARRDGGDRGRRGPSFTPPPEVPLRPKPKRLRPGKTHRTAVLADLPDEQKAIADLALQGLGAVRQRVREENARAAKEGRPEMPEATVMKMAEDLLPRLRVADWLDRAEAAKRQMEHLDLRDLRSVVAAAGDPTIARDEGAAALVDELKVALAHKQEQELLLWFGDVDAALAVGRVIRALRLSSQPPKAGVPFPVDIAQRLADSVNASLAPMDSPERWSAMLEAAAFSPVRALIKPVRKPDVVDSDLLATVKRLGPALPQIAELFEVEVDPAAPMPKPLRTNPRRKEGQAKDSQRSQRTDEPRPAGQQQRRRTETASGQPAPVIPPPPQPTGPRSTQAPAAEPPVAEAPAAEAPAAEAPATETPVAEAPVAEAPVAEAPATEAPVAEAPAAEAPAAAAPAEPTPVLARAPEAAAIEPAATVPALSPAARPAAIEPAAVQPALSPAAQAAATEAPATEPADAPTPEAAATAPADAPSVTTATSQVGDDDLDQDDDGERHVTAE